MCIWMMCSRCNRFLVVFGCHNSWCIRNSRCNWINSCGCIRFLVNFGSQSSWCIRNFRCIWINCSRCTRFWVVFGSLNSRFRPDDPLSVSTTFTVFCLLLDMFVNPTHVVRDPGKHAVNPFASTSVAKTGHSNQNMLVSRFVGQGAA